MSGCGQNGQGEEENATDEVIAPVRDNYKQKPASKVVRVLTVLAYLLSVSLAAILLSVYYIWVWKSPELPPLNNTEETNAIIHNYSGGTNISIDPVVIQPAATGTTPDLINGNEVDIFGYNSTLISTIRPESKQNDINKTLDNIGTLNDTDSIT